MIFAILFALQAMPQGAWTKKKDFNSGRTGTVTFSTTTKGYVSAGYDDNNTYNDLWEYDPQNDTWTQKADFGGSSRAGAVGFSIGNKGYIGTGEDLNGYTKDFWEYDPFSNKWVQRANFPGAARTDAIGFSIGNRGYLGTGVDSDTAYKDFWEFDPVKNLWFKKADFKANRWSAIGFSVDTKGYLGCGFNKSGMSETWYSDLWEFDPNSNKWTWKNNFPLGTMAGGRAFAIGFRAYIGIGSANSSNYKDFWEYDPQSNKWSQQTDFPGQGAEYGFAAFSIGNKGYFGLGFTESNCNYIYYNEMWEFDPLGIVGLKERLSEATLLLYPNPASDQITVRVENQDKENLSVMIYDASGKLTLFVHPGLASGDIAVNTSSLTRGTYILKVKVGSTILSERLVIAD